MRRFVIVIIIFTLLIAFPGLARGSEAASMPWEFTLGLNTGIPSWIQLDFEYKNGPWAGGISTGIFWVDREINAEIDLFARYYFPLGSGFNIFIAARPQLLIMNDEDTDYNMVLVGIKAGPGIDFRWKHLRVAFEGGFRLPLFVLPYVQLGLGYIF